MNFFLLMSFLVLVLMLSKMTEKVITIIITLIVYHFSQVNYELDGNY